MAVRKRISVLVLAGVMFIFGLVSYASLPRESAPDITIPFVFVMTEYPGVAPEDIETVHHHPHRKKAQRPGGGQADQVLQHRGHEFHRHRIRGRNRHRRRPPKTKDKVDLAKPELPADLEDDPEVIEVNISELPIIVLSLSGDVGLVRLKKMAEDLEEEIESIPGVLEAEVTGGLEREIRVEPYPDKLAYYGLSILRLQTVIAEENRNISGGVHPHGRRTLPAPGPGGVREPGGDLRSGGGAPQGRPVYLKDVARVVDGFKDEEGRSRLNGREAVNMQVKKRAGENIIRIIEQVDRPHRAEEEDLGPPGSRSPSSWTSAKDIRIMVSDLENNIVSGLVLVIVVLFFVMGVRNAVLVSLAIPFSMFLSFVVLHALGITLNMVVLFSLTLSLGMLVDNAIVIVENIFRYMEQGVPRLQAAVKATAEVAQPVAASTLTTVAAFFPILFWPGIMGEFMNYLPKTVIITLLSSLFVALVINPALAAFFLRLPAGHRLVG